jgi:hypothetical protein
MANPDSDMQNATAALIRAAKRARELAARTGTKIVYYRDGELVRETPSPGNKDSTFTCKWSAEELALVKQVAKAMGVPYQDYIKQAANRRAVEDLASMRAAALHQVPQNIGGTQQPVESNTTGLPESAQTTSKQLEVQSTTSGEMLVKEPETS